MVWGRRLGNLLELLGADEHAAALESVLRYRRHFLVPLEPSAKKTGLPSDLRWKVAVNAGVELGG